MARYSKIGHNVWGDERFLRLSAPRPNARTLWLFLLSCPLRTSLPGVIQAGLSTLAEALGWPMKATAACWLEIEKQGMARADWIARIVWLPKSLTYDPPHNPNVAKSWGKALSELRESEIRREIESFIESFLKPFDEPFLKSFREGLGNRSGNDYRNIPLPPPASVTASRLPPPASETIPETIPATAKAPGERVSRWNGPPTRSPEVAVGRGEGRRSIEYRDDEERDIGRRLVSEGRSESEIEREILAHRSHGGT